MLYFDNNERYANILNGPNNILAVEYLLDNGEKLTTVKIGTVKEICDYFNHTDITGFEEALPSSLKKMLTNRGFKIIDCKWVKPQEVFANAKTTENYHLY